ncbi:hypothetical protein JTE90_028712 [Oedothorax gibbosus]|uniref:Leucine-rich repeat-containing protein 45 n=1 Tax=Oedothorax gibbosus TaxID=931172 RepID=A0AAV6U508_9ARAC|nr:hypothetical protein JTE90_028712 [Oedothorax gibbosus]
MESFKFLYLEVCKQFNIPQCGKLLSRIKDAGNSPTLNLSSVQLTDLTCKAFGQALSKDVHIKELDCNNCMFSDEGLINILAGIEKNKFLHSLHLKGNNIRSLGTQALGKLFRHNNHLQNLYLEWNGLGIFPEKFALFCEGLCTNTSLKVLDLRNNQLNHVCAQSLSDVILRNSSLQTLDIRWNNIGLTGGRAILKSLCENKSLLSLETSGNDLPMDILNAISIAISASSKRFISNNEKTDKIKYLASKLQAKEEERQSQVKSLMEQIEKLDSETSKMERWNTNKLSEVEANLFEKDKSCENLNHIIRKLESEMWTLTVEKDQLKSSLSSLEKRNKELKDDYQFLLDKEKKKKDESERELFEQIESLIEENTSLKQQLKGMKMNLTHAETENVKLKESIMKIEKRFEQEKEMFNEQLTLKNKKQCKDMEEKELLQEKESLRLKEEFAEEKKSLENKLLLLDSQKIDLEKKLKEKNTQLFSERSQSEENCLQLEKKLISDHEKVRQKLEERIVMLEESNKEQYDHLQEDLQLMYQLKTDVTALDLNLAEQDYEIERLQKLLEEKNAEMKACEAKVRLEVKEQLKELLDSKEKIKKQADEYSSLQNSINEMEAAFQKELDLKTKTQLELKAEIQLLKEKNLEIIEDEKKRFEQLQKAFEMYMQPNQARNDKISPSGDR